MAFEESKHPRDKNGQFTSKGSSKNATSKPTEEKKYEKVSKNQTTTTPKQKVEYDEDYERSWGLANDEEIEKIEIDGDYERAVGPAPDPEDDPEGYKKYIKDYKKWVKNGESWDGLDGLKEDDAWENWEEWNDYDAGKTHGYATIDDYNRANEIIDELDTINKKWKNDDRELLKTWQNKSLSDKEYNAKNDELYKKANDKKATLKKELDEITSRADKFKKQYNEKKKAKDENDRKQAYKLFNLPF